MTDIITIGNIDTKVPQSISEMIKSPKIILEAMKGCKLDSADECYKLLGTAACIIFLGCLHP